MRWGIPWKKIDEMYLYHIVIIWGQSLEDTETEKNNKSTWKWIPRKSLSRTGHRHVHCPIAQNLQLHPIKRKKFNFDAFKISGYVC